MTSSTGQGIPPRGARILLTGLLLIATVLPGCGQKLELPPQPEPGRIPEPGTYNTFTVWSLEEPGDLAVRASYVFVIQGERELRAYLSYRKELAPAGIIEPFTGLVQPVRVTVAKRDSTFVIVADRGDMTIKRYFYLGGDPVFTFSDPSWVEFSGLAADSRLNVYVSDASRDSILVYDDRGNFVRILSDHGTGSGYVIAPHGLAHNGQMVIVADTGKDWVQRLDPDTSNIAVYLDPIGLEEELFSPADVATDPDGEFIFVADSRVVNDTLAYTRVLKFLTTGAFEDTVYSPTKITDIDLPLRAPAFIDTWDDQGTNRVYVCDPSGGRIAVLELLE